MKVTDFEEDKCCGCGMCAQICPTHAIKMEEDDLGYIYPVINEDKCVNCGKCYNTCAFNKNADFELPIDTYAAVRADAEKLQKSSSGGVFAAIAESLLKSSEDWVVAGCALDDKQNAKHVVVRKYDKLDTLYGSKYVQSSMENIYQEIKCELDNNKKVLFSGTPCQVAAIKEYVGNSSDLFTIEVICHGVPNQRMFTSYLKSLSPQIVKFTFRDKKQGWSFNNSYENAVSVKKVNHRLSSYMTYFLNGDTYRDSCYVCPFAKETRGADITIGDFWGIIRECPDLKDKVDIEKGVSCMIVNTEKGKTLIEKAEILKYPVDYMSIRKGNEPLNHPSRYTDRRKDVMSIWGETNSWDNVTAFWKKNDYKLSYSIWSNIPIKIQNAIRVLLNRR